MSRSFKFTCVVLLLLTVVFFSCQKEVSFEQGRPSIGSLRSSAGDCLPKTIKGTYKATQVLVADSNYIDVSVDVTTAGTYTIKSDTINGYSFSTSGTFTAAGPATVRLKGAGTPLIEGINDFEVSYDTSHCFVSVTVLPSGSSSGGSAAFALQGAGGGCTSFSVAGTYTQATPLTSANKVTLNVNVTTPGSWTLSSNTVSGFSFAGSGTFTATGTQTITLTGSGTPTATGSQTFSVTAGAGTCTFDVTVQPNTTPAAAFALNGTPGSCTAPTIGGTYTVGTALNASNTITLGVNVTTPGIWTVSTNTVAGMTFGGTGTFTAAGAQTIALAGTGTPSASGSQTFSVTAGSSNCSFSVTVNGTAPAPNTDHLPLTANTYWTYNDPFAAGDTLKRVNDGAATHNGNPYRAITEYDNEEDPVWEFHYRKSGNDYFEYTTVHDYALVTFDDPVPLADILFLKEGLTNGATWTSAEYSGTEGGVAKKLQYSFTCTDANASGVVINGKTYNNVYKISWKPRVSTSSGPYSDEGLLWESWYAQGVGMIYMKGTLGTNTYEWKLRFWQVF